MSPPDRADRWRAARTPVLLLALAAAVRLYRLGAYSIWADEACTLYDGVHHVAFHTPLFPWLAAAWARLTSSDFGLRLLPAAFGLLGVYAAWRIGLRLGGRRLAAAAALVLALQPLAVHYARDFRMYTAVAALVLLSWDAFLALAERRSRWILAGYVLATAALLALHDIGVLALAGQILAVAGSSRFRPAWRRLTAGAVLASLTYLPLLARLLFIVGRIQKAEFWAPPVTWRTPFFALRVLSSGYEPPAQIYLPLTVLAVGLGVLGAWRAGDRRVRALFVYGMVLPLALYLVANLILPQSMFSPRYLTFCTGPLALAAAAGALALPGRRLASLVLAGLAALQFTSITYQYRNLFAGGSFIEVRPRDEFRPAAELVAESFRPGDVVGTTCESGAFPIWYYLEYRRGLPTNRMLDIDDVYRNYLYGTYNLKEYTPKYVFANDNNVDEVVVGHRRLWLYSSQWERGEDPQNFFYAHRMAVRHWLTERYPIVFERHFAGVDVALFDLTRPLPPAPAAGGGEPGPDQVAGGGSAGAGAGGEAAGARGGAELTSSAHKNQ